jgi:arginine deiminase
MVPSMMQDLLFDDILHGARAREEHRRFQHDLPGDGSAGPAHENAPDER